MNVLHLISALSGGGAERQLSYLATEQARRGYRVTIGYTSEGPSPEISADGVTAAHIRAKSNQSPMLLPSVMHLVRATRADVVQTWSVQFDIVVGALRYAIRPAWILREPTGLKAYSAPTLKQRLRHVLGRYADGIVANSKDGVDYWMSIAPKCSVEFVPNAVPIERIAAVEARPLPPPLGSKTCRTVAVVGRLQPSKRVDLVLRSCAKLAVSDWGCAVFGTGCEMAALQSLVKDLGIQDRTVFRGYVAPPSLWAEMKGCSVFVSLSEYEGMPNSVTEALAAGMVAVLSDIPAHRQFAAGGLPVVLVQPSDLEGVSKALQRALDMSSTTNRWQTQNGNKLPSSSRVAANYEQIYSSACARAMHRKR